MLYDFDTVVDRRHTFSFKYDALQQICPTANEDTIPLFVADMDFTVAQPILDALHKTVDTGIFGYTLDTAEPRYAEAVCHWWQKQYRCTFSPDDVVYVNGTVEAVNVAIRAFTQPGDGVILQRPVYGHFNTAVEQDCNRRVVDNHFLCDAHGFYSIDYDDLEAKCAEPNNRAMIFCSPANPVGRVWTVDEIRRVAAITKKYNVLLIADEVHCDIVRKDVQHHPVLSVVDDKSNVIMLTAINKSFNLAGLQCSNAIIPDAFLRARFETALGERMPTPFAIAALLAAYSEGREWLEQMNAYVDLNIDVVLDYLGKNLPWVKAYRPEGTYCLWLDFSACGLPDEEIHRRIYEDANVVLQDGTVHDPLHGQGFQRICVPCSRSVLLAALARITAQFQDIAL